MRKIMRSLLYRWCAAMLKNSMDNHPKLVKVLLQARQLIVPGGVTMFVVLNVFNIFSALKILFFMLIYNQMTERKQEEEYLDIFSFKNFETLVDIVASGLVIFLVCVALIWVLDRIGIRSALKGPEFRRLERSVRRQMKQLENHDQLFGSFEEFRDERKQTEQLLLKTKEIVQKLYYAAKANDPNNSKPKENAETDKSAEDLFDYAGDEKDQTVKAKTRRKLAAFKQRFK